MTVSSLRSKEVINTPALSSTSGPASTLKRASDYSLSAVSNSNGHKRPNNYNLIQSPVTRAIPHRIDYWDRTRCSLLLDKSPRGSTSCWCWIYDYVGSCYGRITLGIKLISCYINNSEDSDCDGTSVIMNKPTYLSLHTLIILEPLNCNLTKITLTNYIYL